MLDSLKAFESIVRLKPGLLGPCYTWRARVFVLTSQSSVDVPGLWAITKSLLYPSKAKIHLFGVAHVAGQRSTIYTTSKCGHAKLGTTCPMDNESVPNGIGYCIPCLYHARKRDEYRRWELREIDRCLFGHTPPNRLRNGKRVDTRKLMGKG